MAPFPLLAVLLALLPAPSASFFHVTENFFPPEMVAKIIPDAHATSDWALGADTLEQGKRATMWMPRDHKPKFHIERAILALADSVLAQFPGNKFIGYEWWVQRVPAGDVPSFHYDKDEARSSIKRQFVFPTVSSIYYLNDIGSPTLVYNLTCPDGRTRVPERLQDGYLSYPKTNKYILFNGTWAHGVLPGAFLGSPYDGRRDTLLINFWETMPEPPNTVHTPHDELRAEQHDAATLAAVPMASPERAVVPATEFDFSSAPGTVFGKFSDGGSFVNMFHYGLRLPDGPGR